MSVLRIGLIGIRKPLLNNCILTKKLNLHFTVRMINLSFAGCGFLGIYHVGVASCFREYAPHVLVDKIAGASVGSIAAAALICDVSLGQTASNILAIALEARDSIIGPLSPNFDLNGTLRQRLSESLPPNAYRICSGRLHISVTRWRDKKNVLISQFDSNEELIQALLCSCFIPFYSGYRFPIFRGEQYVDGGMSDNLPVLDENTITVSPFAGEHDICPQDETCNILQVNVYNTSIAVSPGNFYRLCRILFPPKPEILSNMCQQGFDDALKYLQRKRIISCTRCLGVRSVVRIRGQNMEIDLEKGGVKQKHEHEPDNCDDCKRRRQLANSAKLPENVVLAIERTCNEFNKGLSKWVIGRKLLKILSFLGLPATLPLDVTLAIFIKVYQILPDFRGELKLRFQDVMELIKRFIERIDSNKIIYRAMFSCELSITEFNYGEDNISSSYNQPILNGLPHETCSVKTEEEKVPKRKFSMKRPMSAQNTPVFERRQQRRSYAGFSSNFQIPDVQPPARRNSFSEAIQPERVIRNMRFGFTVGVPGISQNDKHADLFQSLKSLGESNNELNIMELAKKAVGIEHEFLHQHSSKINSNNNVSKALHVSENEPVMSYCYVDEDKTIKINEIYNVTDTDNSLILTDEEKQLNNDLEWESNWINPSEYQKNSVMSFVDSLDDHEFDTSDNECDLTGYDVFLETKDTSPELTKAIVDSTKPHRKTSIVSMK